MHTSPQQQHGAARFCGVAQAAHRLGVSKMTLYRLIDQGAFPAVRVRSRIVIPVAALENLENEAIRKNAVVEAPSAPPGE